MLITSRQYRKAVSLATTDRSDIEKLQATATKFLDPTGKKPFDFAQPDSVYIVAGN
jgi:hypothetical protein